MKNYFVYITTNPRKTVLYVGVTNDLSIRIQQHLANKGDKQTFAGRYYCYKLVYYENFPNIKAAIEREKKIKKCSREAKNRLINEYNPNWNFIDAF